MDEDRSNINLKEDFNEFYLIENIEESQGKMLINI
jgi:hypothetical protein